ncbi:GPP34 family phosphoprotein [Mangrovihabitans endophyticus]|uniref:Golgi phosphoprotein 3 (GPP34) n=1 Tax=Mangrovihabitans endophyticus TaxID=1751298 RepID=A0A8J3FTP8_9ACTN|nr:GPP34 family phosphoprotein [Mangrovihabitans endophyticus]GGL21133.1 hypothetical protein GCM10012284_64750 [Mangrovihabitans endophyticus]
MLADEAFWLTHHDWTGGLRTSARAAGVMVAAALLGELATSEAVGVSGGMVVAWVPAPVLDELGGRVVTQIAGEGQRHPAGTWLEVLSAGCCERVAQRLVASGAAVAHRAGVRRRLVVTARQGDTGPAWVHAGLVHAVREGWTLTDTQRFLLALIWNSSITEHPLQAVGEDLVEHAYGQVQQVVGVWRELIEAATTVIRTGAVAR